MNYLRPELLDRLARAFALGTLSAAAHRRFTAVLKTSHEARRSVDAWHERYNQLAISIPSMQPTKAVWQAIRQRTGAALPPRTRAWWVLAWGATLGAAFGALMVVGLVRVEPRWLGVDPASTVAVAPSYVGLLTNDAGEPVVLASSLRHGRLLSLKLLKPVTPPAGQVAQLWALPGDGRPPFALGVIPAGAKATLMLADTSERLFAKVPRLAVSFEPTPVTGDAQPSAAFVLTGHCVKLW